MTQRTRHAVYVSPVWPLETACNGIATYVQHLTAALPQFGVTPHVLPITIEEAHREEARHAGIVDAASIERTLLGRVRDALRQPLLHEQVLFERAAWMISTILRTLHARVRLDLVEMEESFGIAGHMRRYSPVPTVVRLHGPWAIVGDALGVPADDAFRRRVESERVGIRSAAGLTAPSRFVLDWALRQCGEPLGPYRVIPNPAALAEASRCVDPQRPVSERILFVGRFDRVKGADTLLEAFARLHARRPNAKLEFVGPDRGLVEESGRSVGLEEFAERTLPPTARAQVTFHGPLDRESIDRLRLATALTVVASRFETFPLVVLEAMAQGAPLIASRAGGIPEILDWAPSDMLFEPGNAEELAERLDSALGDPARMAALGAEGRSVCERRYAPAIVAKATAEFNEEVLAAHGQFSSWERARRRAAMLW